MTQAPEGLAEGSQCTAAAAAMLGACVDSVVAATVEMDGQVDTSLASLRQATEAIPETLKSLPHLSDTTCKYQQDCRKRKWFDASKLRVRCLTKSGLAQHTLPWAATWPGHKELDLLRTEMHLVALQTGQRCGA